MTYTLYSSDGSGGFAVEVALVKAGAPYKLVAVDTGKGEQGTPEYVAINPMRQVPAMTLPDGTVMTESAAMVVHLAHAFPDKGLAPKPATPAHARFLRWMFFMAANLYEADLRYFYSDRYTTDPAGIEGVKAAGAAHMKKCFAILEEALAQGPFLCGPERTMADVYLAMLMDWSPDPVAAPRLAAIRTSVLADPQIAPLWRRHGFKT
ncbi:MAG: glutathione S-transferase family protein [Dongiaceae bacterium]